jgi:phage shock protein E
MRYAALGLCFAVMAVLAACGGQGALNSGGVQSAGRGGERFTVINADRFEEMSRQGGVVILDVRTPEEYAEGHIHGALNMDGSAGDFAEKAGALNKSATYLVYCRSGRRSAQACGELAGLGFGQLYNLEGGVSAWSARGKAIEK